MQKYVNDIATVVGGTLAPLANASCAIYLTGTTTLASIYWDNGVTSKPNPTNSSATGRLEFYAADGRYDIAVSKSGFSSTTIADVLLEDPATSADLLYVPSGTGAVTRGIQGKLQENISVTDFGAVGNGVVDDTTRIQAAITSGSGKNIFLNPGTFSLSNLSIAASRALTGGGKYLTSIVRSGTGNALGLTAATNGQVASLSINNNKSVTGYDGHGIAGTQPKTVVRDVSVSDFGSTSGGGGSGVLIYNNISSPKLIRITDSEMSGNSTSTSSYGWILEGCDTSFASNIYTVGIKDYGHELKNLSKYSSLSNLICESSSTALGYGQDTGTGPSFNVATGIVSKANDVGFVCGYSNYNLINAFLHNNTGAPGTAGTSHLARFDATSSYNAVFAGMAIGSFVDTVRYSGNANYVQLVSHDTTTNVVQLQSTAAKNATEIAHPGARTSILSSIADGSGNSIRSANANPVWCHATGERVGSISGRFWDKLGSSGSTINSNHYWVKESDAYAIQAFSTPGNNADVVGISYATPASSLQGAFLYNKTTTDANDFWALRAGNTDSFRFYNSTFRTSADATHTLGAAAQRWTTVYATTGTINTSDAREKQQIRPLSDAESAVAKRLKKLFRAFKFNDAVLTKGDGARIHVGVLAQDVKSAFEAEGLVAENYAVLCFDEWPEQLEKRDEDNNVIEEYRAAGNRYGVRYDELLAFVLSAI